MKSQTTFVTFIIALGIPLLVGSVSGALSGNSMASYHQLVQPSFAPPDWIFPIVWTILFVLMGIASYLIYTSDAAAEEKHHALALYGIQLVFNFFWSLIFFVGEWYLFAFIWLVLLWGLIVLTIKAFSEISKTAAWLLVPYLLWVTFAGYLNLIIFFLN